MEDEVRLRVACDRCHSQKLRCSKREGADVCDRCTKADAPCFFSPFRQKKDPEKKQNGDKAPVNSHDPRFSKSIDERSNNFMALTPGSGHKRKRITTRSEKPIGLDPQLHTSVTISHSTEANEAHSFDAIVSDGSADSLTAFHDLMGDSTYGIMNLGNMDEYPPLNFDMPSLPTFRESGEKLNGVLHFRSPSPLTIHASNSSPFGRYFSPLADADMSSSQAAVALHDPQLQVWAGHMKGPQEQSVSQCIRQLSELSRRLYEHGITIPPQDIHAPVPENEPYEDVMNTRAQNYENYKADDTLQITQELIDIYPSFMDLFTRRKVAYAPQTPQDSTAFDLNTLNDVQPKEVLGPIAPSITNPLALDHSSILLIVSCHSRLIDIYDELFKHMQVCIDQRGMAFTPEQTTFKAPQLRIGNYVPPTGTAIRMQMLLLLHFATSLCDHAVELESHIREPEDGAGSSKNSQSAIGGDEMKALSLALAKMVKDRANRMVLHLSSMRAMMLKDGMWLEKSQ